jgi:hypothetical protein
VLVMGCGVTGLVIESVRQARLTWVESALLAQRTQIVEREQESGV